MLPNFKISLSLLLIIIALNLNAQDLEKHVELHKLKISKDKLSDILERIVQHERNCYYYNSKLSFSIYVSENEDILSVTIASIDDLNILLSNEAYGYFKFEKHIFIVRGINSHAFFSITDDKKIFKFFDYSDESFQPKEGETPILYFLVNDRFSQWKYNYKNEDFTVDEISTFCK